MMENQRSVTIQPKQRGLSGSALKWIAIVTMLVDHTAATIVNKWLLLEGVDFMSMDFNTQLGEHAMGLLALYGIMRMIGRIAFPIFCFLLVQGFTHTHDVKKYILRLGVFTLISEIPFDLAFKGTFFYWGYNNVFFTLLFGVFVMWGIKVVEEQSSWGTSLKCVLKILVAIGGMIAAIICHTDYSWMGIFCITLLYVTRNNKVKQIIVGCISFAFEIVAPLAFIPIGFYNGQRGRNMKYFFYIFYPAHLLILYLIALMF
ncbi:MAG: TraX family protein [Niameybacter sp.]